MDNSKSIVMGSKAPLVHIVTYPEIIYGVFWTYEDAVAFRERMLLIILKDIEDENERFKAEFALKLVSMHIR